MAETPPEQASTDFFISYTSVDRAWAEWIAWALEAAGYRTLIQAWDFRPGTNFVHSMNEALAHAERLLAVLSPDYLTSRFTRPEWYAAFAEDSLGEQGKLLPVRVRACDPKGLLGQVVYIDLVGQEESVAETILLDGIPTGRAKPLTRPGFPGEAAASEAAQPAKPRFPGSLPPIWNVPHDRNPNFTGRTDLLSNLYDSLHAGQATVLRQILRGLGGVGKTQLALEYTYRYASDYGVVWWVPSETSPTTVYAELSRELGLPEAAASESEVRVKAVKRWLEQHEGWLLIFDNATAPETIRPYLPHGASGHVIITSRFTDWRNVADDLTVEVFERRESVTFLKQRTGQSDDKAANDLAEALGDLPLALAQAADYISATGITLAEYVPLFLERRHELWQDEEPPEAYPEPVATAWSLSMEQMEAEVPAAAELLRLMAFLAPEPVARDWLSEGAEHLPEALCDLVTDQLAWNRSLRVFRRYGLVEVTEAGLVVHRLVQAVTRDRLAAAERQAWAAAAVQVVEAAYPEDTYSPRDIGVWVSCAELLGHALVTTDRAEEQGVALQTTSQLLNRAGEYLRAQGRYAAAIPFAERALRIDESTLGADHPDVAISLNNLALLYRNQGRYEDAEPLFRRALSIREETLNGNHPDVAPSLNNLALLYRNQGRYEDAEPLFRRALAIGESTLGANHPAVAARLNNLASLYQAQGRYEDAEALFRRALSIREETLNGNHPDVAQSLNNLASLYQDQVRYEDAEPLYLRALAISESTLGANHPTVAARLNNLADLCREQGHFEKAEPLAQRALSIIEETLGSEHPSVAALLNVLGQIYYAQGRYDKVEPLWQRALSIGEQVLGNHPDVAIWLNNLANLYRAQSRYEDAEPLFRRAIEMDEQAYGPDHPEVAADLNNLARLYQDQGRYNEAEPLFRHVLTILDSTLGPDHPKTQTVRRNYERFRQQRDAAG